MVFYDADGAIAGSEVVTGDLFSSANPKWQSPPVLRSAKIASFLGGLLLLLALISLGYAVLLWLAQNRALCAAALITATILGTASRAAFRTAHRRTFGW